MPTNYIPTGAEYFRFLPEIILSIAGTLLMVAEPLTSAKNKGILANFSLAALFAALWAAVVAYSNPGSSFQNMLVVDGFSTFFRVLVIVVGILAVFSSGQYLRRERAEPGEYHALILFSIVGQCIMATASELMMVFIGLEISSIATYILAGYLRDDKRNNESALKYFLLGSFATAFLLYGIAWIYGLTGSTNLLEIHRQLSTREIAPSINLAGTAAALMFVGFAFKVSAAPFQVWAPDVYQGAPAPVAAFMSAGPKAAAFAVFIRVYMTAFGSISNRWEPIVWFSALLTMVVGNFAALTQSNIKRLLAYSSIAHAGYVLVAVTTHSEIGTAAAMFYLASYAFMNIGAFAVVIHIARRGERYVNVDDLAGLGTRQPGTAALLTIFLLSLIGVPLTGGFFAKFYVFKAALDGNLIWLSILGLLNSAVAAYYYLRIIVVMYMHESTDSTARLEPLGAGIRTALWISAAATIFLGVFPGWVLDFAGKSSTFVK
ncbi:MAG TPA: NADH-quinone oxidoreductase subunit N [Bryobacteraceae bacterium]|nr:NADH-quinone oxidoreductase subunit N [Bryobacteraceae bacterium]